MCPTFSDIEDGLRNKLGDTRRPGRTLYTWTTKRCPMWHWGYSWPMLVKAHSSHLVVCSCVMCQQKKTKTLFTYYCQTPKREAHNRVGTAGTSGALVWACACMYVCLSVTGLRLKYMGLCIVYVPFGTCCSGCHRAMEWRSRSRTRNIEDDARMSPDVWKTVITAGTHVIDWPSNWPTVSVQFTLYRYVARSHAGTPYKAMGHAMLVLMCTCGGEQWSA